MLWIIPENGFSAVMMDNIGLALNPVLSKNGRLLPSNDAAIDIELLKHLLHTALTAEVQLV
jgi:hypothetical protein